jgi:hypothetical protein
MAIEKQQKQAQKDATKKDFIKSVVYTVAQGFITAILLSLGLTAVSPLISFAAGLFTVVSAVAFVADLQVASEKYSAYSEINSKNKTEEQPKKDKKLGSFKKIKNIFSKSKKHSEEMAETLITESVSEPEEKTNINQQPEMEKEINMNLQSESVAPKYTLSNCPKVTTVDLSNITVKPGLDISVQHFIVNKNDEVMRQMIELYIEKQTGTPAMYTDKVIDNQEKRVYMLVK